MKFLVLGIGNVLLSDEGTGVHLCNLLKNNYKFSHSTNSIEFVDGGTLAMALTPIIAKFDQVLMIDCIAADDAKIGDVFFFDFADVPPKINFGGSAHEMEMLQTLEFMDIVGDRPPTMVLGVVPKRIVPMTCKLSDELISSSRIMEKKAISYIKSLGFSVEKVDDKNIQEIADEFENGSL
ncbi:MAG: HyaD/HybD family hydrogenase maturation endopeptidase [Campylobacter sp.]|nr:HyaD/HybD family hydrogenase maturation endopeptidase [Campylobacter sp.]